MPSSAAAAMNDPDILWLLINLDRSPERLATMRRHLDGLGIAFSRVAGVNGRTLEFPLPGIDPALYRRSHGRELRPGEAGCYLGHLKAMKAFLANPARFAVILEDDVALKAETGSLIAALTAPGAPDDWDLVKLEARHKSLPLPIRTIAGEYRLATMLFRTTGGAAYLLNRRAAQACLAGLLPMRAPFDHAFDRDWALGIRGRAIVPFPATSQDGTNYAVSNIETGDVKTQKLTGLAKLPALGWRARTEAMRVVSALWGWCAPGRAMTGPGKDKGKGKRLPL